MSDGLTYKDSEGLTQTLDGCRLTHDNRGRYWLWSDALQHNLAYKIANKEDCLLAAIKSLLFTISLRDEEIQRLSLIKNLAQDFVEQLNFGEV